MPIFENEWKPPKGGWKSSSQETAVTISFAFWLVLLFLLLSSKTLLMAETTWAAPSTPHPYQRQSYLTLVETPVWAHEYSSTSVLCTAQFPLLWWWLWPAGACSTAQAGLWFVQPHVLSHRINRTAALTDPGSDTAMPWLFSHGEQKSQKCKIKRFWYTLNNVFKEYKGQRDFQKPVH